MEVAAKTSRTYLEDFGNHENLHEITIDNKVIPVEVNFNGAVTVSALGLTGYGKSVTAAKFHFTQLYRAQATLLEQ